MATDFLSIYGDIQAHTNDTSTASLVLFKKFVNKSYRDAWCRHPWTERHKQAFLPLTAPYVSTASITATVTNGSAVVTLAGSTLPAYAANTVKFALGVGSEWYGVLSRDSTTQLTLDRVYLGDSASGQPFIIYQDVYALETDVGTLLGNQLSLHKPGYGGSIPVSRARAENEWGFPTGTGDPYAFILHDRPGTAYRIRVGPNVPGSASLAIRYSYLKDITELSATTDEPLFVETRRDMIFWGALAQAYMLHGRAADARDALAMFERLIAQAWQAERALHPVVTSLRTIDGARSGGYPNIAFPVVAP